MAFTSSNGRTQTSLAEINVTPFVDVVLVLLIIFMVTASTVESGIEVDVPQTRTVAIKDNSDRLVVTIDRKQKLYIGKDAINIYDLGKTLRSMMGNGAQKDVFLRCDKTVPFEIYAHAIDDMRTHGVEKINFVTKPYDGRPE